jgi:hypothetical protein
MELSEQQQELIIKLHMEGLTHGAIVRVTGHDLNTVKKYVRGVTQIGAPCGCQPGAYFIGCDHCDMWKGPGDVEE